MGAGDPAHHEASPFVLGEQLAAVVCSFQISKKIQHVSSQVAQTSVLLFFYVPSSGVPQAEACANKRRV